MLKATKMMKKKLEDIDTWGHMNILADNNAKRLLQQVIMDGIPLVITPAMDNAIGPIKYSFQKQDKYITSYLGRTLRQTIARDRALHYWDTHGKQVYHPLSDLSILEHASNNTPIWQRRWLTKCSHRMCGVGKWLRR